MPGNGIMTCSRQNSATGAPPSVCCKSHLSADCFAIRWPSGACRAMDDLHLGVSDCLHSNSPCSSCQENSTYSAPYFRGGYRCTLAAADAWGEAERLPVYRHALAEAFAPRAFKPQRQNCRRGHGPSILQRRGALRPPPAIRLLPATDIGWPRTAPRGC